MAPLERARLRMANLSDEMALCFDDEVLCEGSDAEDGPLAKAERQKRREAIELRYLAGHAPLIMSAQLRGPFDKNSGWENPWRSKRPTQKQPTNRATATEPLNLAHKTTSVVGLGKHSRNDSNLSSSAGMRTKALAECSSISLDIVNNRQPEPLQLYPGFKRFAANQLERPTDFANLNERENIPQNLNAGTKRRADTNWLKGADVGKRPRNNWSDPTSPTPKERTRDIIGNDKDIIDASSISMSSVNIAKFNRQLPDETASLSEFEDIPISTADSVLSKRAAAQGRGDGDVQPTRYATVNTVEDKQCKISMELDSVSRSPSTCRKGPSNSERPHVESLSNVSNEDEGGSYAATEIGRTAPEYSLNISSFVEPESSFEHKSVQSCVSLASFEPSPVRSFSQNQLSQEILHGLSQASQLARSAEQLTPLKPRDPTSNIVHHPSDLGKRNTPSFSSKKTPLQIASASLNHASQTRSQSQPLQKSPVEVKMLKPKRDDRSRSFDSPLPPGSLKYRRVRRKAPIQVESREDSDTNNGIEKQKTPVAAPLQSGEVQDSTHKKDVVSPTCQVLNHVDQAEPQLPACDSRQRLPDSVPTIEITDNDAAEKSKAKPLDGDTDNRALTQTSVFPISPAISDGVNELDARHESCPRPIVDGHGNEGSLDASSMRCQESGESGGVLIGQQAPGSQPPPIEAIEEANSRGVEHRVEVSSPKATTSIVAEEPNLEDVTLSQDTGSPLEAPELTDSESTLRQILQPHAAEGPNLKSSPLPPLPDIVDDDQLSEASFTSAAEESNSKSPPAPAAVDNDQVSEASFTSAPEEVDSLPVPQSPWAVEEDIPAPQAVSVERTLGPGNFSMSQSKDAALLLVDTEPHCSAAESPHDKVKLSDRKPESPRRDAQSVDRNSEPPHSNGIVFSGPVSSESTAIHSILLSPKHLPPRKSQTPQSARVGNHDPFPLSNPWANNSQSPMTHSRPAKRKKRVSFNSLQLDSDNEGASDKQPKSDQPSNNAPGSRDLSSPPPPPEAETLTEGDNAFHRKLKWTSGILSKRASKDHLGSVSTENAIVPGSPGVGAMAEAFLAADARIQSEPRISRDVCGNNVVAESENFNGPVEDGEQQDKVIAAPAVLAIPMMTESQLVNPWGDEDEAPPFSMADCGPDVEDGLVEDVLSDMDAMLGDWNVDAELDRAKREVRGKTERDVTARERLVGAGY
ncbi:hypothetical protein VE03_05546 [Pseudogymnoascus sp. 23342-1-I1]|nr:hypothetical protein VE03_05546 [Pseudogymnoascus sp. 23342-1-I1]